MTNHQASYKTTVTPSIHSMSIVSLVFGILGLTLFFIVSIIAIITGKKALREIKADPTHYTGVGMAKAGIIMGWISIVLFILCIFGVTLFLLIGSNAVITYIEILIFIIVMFFVGYPIFKRQEVKEKTQENEALGELIHKKEAVYTSIKDLDFDYRTGKLSEDDYNELKDRYELEALHILKDIDDSGKKIPLSPPLEKGDEGGFIFFCPKCGTKAKMGDNFCFKCGAKLPT